MSGAAFAGLDLLATAVVLLDDDLGVRYVNPAAESLFEHSAKILVGQSFSEIFAQPAPLAAKLRQAVAEQRGFWLQSVTLTRADGESQHLNILATPIDSPEARLLLELRSIDQRLRAEREEKQLTQHVMNRELIRNLAHEIKNPLGGLRGSAQLLERELDRPDLREYTQVIIKEADRLQLLMDRLLTPNRRPHIGPVNVHEVCERVRSLMRAEFGEAVCIRRDYDTSLPDIQGDREQLIQVLLNIVRNAAQAILGSRKVDPGAGQGGEPAAGEIVLRTRIARSVTIARDRHRLALELQVVDNGPGIPEELRERVFYPLVSGREGGTGLGLTLAQTYVQHHRGTVEFDSEPGRTAFRIVLPLGNTGLDGSLGNKT